jgi:glycosyltransferase involved in cell wall biosynthesis
MKINHRTVFCPIISKHDNGGGIKSTIQLLNGLSKRNKNITVLMRKDATFIDKFEKEIQIYFFEVEPIISIKKPIHFFKLSKWFNTFLINHDLIDAIIFCSDRPALMLLNFYAKKYPNIVYVSRGNNYNNFSAKLLVKFVMPYIKKIIAISQHQLNVFNESIKTPIESKVIFNGLVVPEETKKPFQNEIIKIAVVGGICYNKNQKQAIELIHHLGNKYRLLLFGNPFTDIDREYLKQLESFISEHSINNVDFMGYEANMDILFSQIDILLSASLSEGFGRTIVEGMLHGIPVIANQLGGAPAELINNNVDGMLYDGTTENLINCVNNLAFNAEHRNLIIKNARYNAQNSFSDKKMIDEYISFLNL